MNIILKDAVLQYTVFIYFFAIERAMPNPSCAGRGNTRISELTSSPAKLLYVGPRYGINALESLSMLNTDHDLSILYSDSVFKLTFPLR